MRARNLEMSQLQIDDMVKIGEDTINELAESDSEKESYLKFFHGKVVPARNMLKTLTNNDTISFDQLRPLLNDLQNYVKLLQNKLEEQYKLLTQLPKTYYRVHDSATFRMHSIFRIGDQKTSDTQTLSREECLGLYENELKELESLGSRLLSKILDDMKLTLGGGERELLAGDISMARNSLARAKNDKSNPLFELRCHYELVVRYVLHLQEALPLLEKLTNPENTPKAKR